MRNRHKHVAPMYNEGILLKENGMADFAVYTIRDWKKKERRLSVLTRTERVDDEGLVNAIRRSGIRFKRGGVVLSDMQVLNLILAERGEQQ